jgi:hypothetical protein
MATVFNIVIPSLAALFFLLTLLLVVRMLQKRAVFGSPFAYGLARQQTRYAIQSDLLRALGTLGLALILGAVYLLRPSFPEPVVPVETATPSPTATVVVEETAVFTPTPTATAEAAGTADPTATATMPVTLTPTPAPTDTPTPEPRLAVVDSPNGLWLRAEPGVGGEQIENLLHLSVLTVLDGLAEVDDLEWQEVLAPSGNQGWVAASFLAYQNND